MKIKILKVINIIIYVAFFLGLLRYFDLNPIALPPPKEKEKPGVPILKDNESDFLLLIDLKNIQKAAAENNFYRNDWSYAWLNTLEQEVGFYSVMEPSMLTKERVLSRRVVVISKSAEGTVSSEMISQFVRRGGVVILELPSGRWQDVTGYQLDSYRLKAKKITYIDQDYLPAPFDEILKQMPLNTFLYRIADKGQDVKVIMEMDNHPAVCLRSLGKGLVIGINFDYGLQLVSIQQGIPSADYRVVKKYRNQLYPEIPQPDDLVGDDRLLTNFYPYADILERMLFVIINKHQPIVKWWYFPEIYDGAFIMTHDEDSFGDKSTYMTDYEVSIDATSTFFIVPDRITEQGLEKMLSQGIDVQLHWDRTQRNRRLFGLIGLWRIRPFTRLYNLEEQIQQLLLRLPKGYKILGNRNHFLVWEGDYTQTFRILYAHNILLDSTYGPDNPYYGYLFGTGLPFYPVDKNGLIIPVVEIPFLDMDGNRIKNNKLIFEGGTMKRLISDSREEFHETIVLIFHPHGMALYPSVDWFRGWLNIYNYARRNNHWVTNLRLYLKFLRDRSQSVVHSEFKNNVLSIMMDSKRDKLTLSIPIFTKTTELQDIKLDGNKVTQYRKVRNLTERILVPIPKGRHLVQVTYGA